MGYQVFPTPSSAVDLGKYSLRYLGNSAANTPATTASINPNLVYYTTNIAVPAGMYAIEPTFLTENSNRQVVIRSSTADIGTVTAAQTTVATLITSTTGTAFGFRMESGWRSQGASGVFRYGTNNQFINAKAFDQGYFAIMGGNANGINDEPIKISTNGASWTRYLPAGLSTSYYIGEVIWRGSTSYYALLNNDYLYQSTDILNWTTASTSAVFSSGIGRDAIYDSVTNRHYIISDNTNIWWSTDITNWSTAAGAGSLVRYVIKRVGDYLMIGGQVGNDTGRIEISTNGINWSTAVIPTSAAVWSTSLSPRIRDIAYNGTRYVAVSDNAAVIIASTDGVNWTTSRNYSTTEGGQGSIYGGVVWDGNYFIVAGYNSTTYGWDFSTDGISWLGMSTANRGGYAGGSPQQYVGYLFYNTNMGRAAYMAFGANEYAKDSVAYTTISIQFSTTPWGVPKNSNTANYIINSYPLSVNVI